MHKIGNELESAGFRKLAILKQINKKTEKELKILVEKSNRSNSLNAFNYPYLENNSSNKKKLNSKTAVSLKPIYEDVL